MAETARPKAVRAGILPRLSAALYDGFILFGLLFLAFIPIAAVEELFGAAVPGWLKSMLVVTIAYAYFVGFWTRGGATTGMRPWRLRVAMSESGDAVTLAAATARFFVLMLTWLALAVTLLYLSTRHADRPMFYVAAALPAVSLALTLVNRRRLALHDLLSGTAVFRLPPTGSDAGGAGTAPHR